MKIYPWFYLMLLHCLSAGYAHAYPLTSGDLVLAANFDAPTSASGGSNYIFFGDDGLCLPNSRDNYGVVSSYHQTLPAVGSVRGEVQRQLATMRARGMHRLSLGIFFIHGANGGTLIDSSNPVQIAQAVQNIRDLLADVRAAGYSEVLFRFFPIGNINPSQPDYQPGLVNEYWNIIQQVRPVVVAAGIPYRLDLGVELAPRDSNYLFIPSNERYKYPNNENWSRAVRDLWQRYVAAYGRDDTIGFSFITDTNPDNLRWRVRHMRYVYEGINPWLYAVDIYPTDSLNAASKFIAFHDAMVREDSSGALGWRDAGWIIAEANYEDPLIAADVSSAIAATGRTVYYLTQWPLDRANTTCTDPNVNVRPPLDWTVWGGYGY